MQDAQVTAPSLPIRRSACDRCKVQKLRCLRDPGEDRCYRCTRADAQCATTANVPIRSRRRIGGVSSKAQKRIRQNGEQQTPPTTGFNYPVSSTSLPGLFGDSNNVPNTVTCPLPEVPESWGPTIYESMFDNGFDGNFASLDATVNKGYTPSLSYQSDTALFSNLPVAASPASALSLPGRQETAINNNTPASLGDVGTTQDPVVEVGRGISESDTHRLAKINLDLVKLLGQIGRGSPEINFNTLVAPIDTSDGFSGTLIHSVLKSSRAFVDVISGLSDVNKKPASHGSSPRTPESRSDSGTDSLTRGHSSPHSSEYLGRTQATPSLVSAIGPASRRSLGSTTLMHILISYIHIIQLHLIIFTHSYENLLEISKSDVPSLHELPGVDFGSFPLQSGNLQATLFIQVIISLFENVENLLGIPQEFQLDNTRRTMSHGGLLSELEFATILRAILAKEELICKPDRGKGGVNALRRYINETRQLLRDSIEP
ncbi:hypothetical protein F4811DRAFT_567311 [Daldinia bambusicola]|nr:hypothetical protein F4811DRAFT_567311 [Daldinia bambusicola]